MASVLAVGLISLLAVAMLALTSQTRNDVLRTSRLVDEAQLEQLALAGEAAMRAGRVEGPIHVPEALAGRGASMTIRPAVATDGTRAFEVKVRLGARSHQSRLDAMP